MMKSAILSGFPHNSRSSRFLGSPMNWFERLTGGLSIGVAILLYAFAVFALAALEQALHTRDGGGFWWTALMLAVLLRITYSFGQFRAEEPKSKPAPAKREKDFNLPL